MIKDIVVFPISYLFVATVLPLIQGNPIRWVDNFAIAGLMLLFAVFWEWAKVPHNYGKEKDE